MKKVTSIKGGGACPEQYKGLLDSGEQFYLRYRWGKGILEIDNEEESVIYADNDPFRGYFLDGEIKQLFQQANISFDESLL